MNWYLDSSAITKLIFRENESLELREFLSSSLITSRISKLEVRRAITRVAPRHLNFTSEVLEDFNLVPLHEEVLQIAEKFPKEITLKTLDAIHVATVIYLGTKTEGLITYDKQMRTNAELLGILVTSPGAS